MAKRDTICILLHISYSYVFLKSHEIRSRLLLWHILLNYVSTIKVILNPIHAKTIVILLPTNSRSTINNVITHISPTNDFK